jgi:hypothetical protein
MFYPGTPLYERARADGLIGTRDGAAYDCMGTGALQFAGHDYLAIWLRIVLNLRNVGVPRWVVHRVIDCVASRPVRKVLDRKWFCPTVFVSYQIMRKIWRNFIHQPFIRPLKYLRRRPREKKRQPTERWTVPKVKPDAKPLAADHTTVPSSASASRAPAAGLPQR